MTHVAQTLLSALLHPAELTCCSRACPERPSKAKESDGKTGALLRPSVASVVGAAFPITRDHPITGVPEKPAFGFLGGITGSPDPLFRVNLRRNWFCLPPPLRASVFQRCWVWFLNWQFRRLWQFWQFLHPR